MKFKFHGTAAVDMITAARRVLCFSSSCLQPYSSATVVVATAKTHNEITNKQWQILWFMVIMM